MSDAPLDPVGRLALAWQPRAGRARLETLLLLDSRLQALTNRPGEPLMAQIRLAWWREQLSIASTHADPLLRRLCEAWGDKRTGLIPLIDGWEHMSVARQWDESAMAAFAVGRGQAFAAFARMQPHTGNHDCEQAALAGHAWSYAQLASAAPTAPMRDEALTTGRTLARADLRNRDLRGIAVIGGLAHRALRRAEPMLATRGAALLAMRLGLTGR